MPEENFRPANRRRGPDLIITLINWMSFTGWIIIIATLILLAQAGPQIETFFDRLLEVGANRSWNSELSQLAFYLMILLAIMGVTGLILNSRRMKRKGDRYRISLIIMTAFSFIGIVVYLASFS